MGLSIENPNYIPLCKKSWLKDLQAYIDNNKDEISEDVDSFKAAVKKRFKSISPMFKAFVASMKYQEFPYQVSQKEYAAFLKRLTSARTPAAAEEAVKQFCAEDRYFLDTKLRPYHPVWYMLLEIEKTHFDIDTQNLIASIYPYILFPQNKTRASLLCALSVTSGMTISSLLEIDSVKKYDTFVVKVTSADKENFRPVLCKADHFIRAVDFMLAQNYSKGRLSRISAENNAIVIGFPISLHHSPALHKALCGHFFAGSQDSQNAFFEKYNLTISTKAEFNIRGTADLALIIDGVVNSREAKLAQILQNADEKMRTALHKVHSHFVQHPTEKVGITTIRGIHPCSPNYATKINDLIDSLDAAIYRTLDPTDGQDPVNQQEETA